MVRKSIPIVLLAALALSGCDEMQDARGFDARMDGKVLRETSLTGKIGSVTDRETGCEYIVIGFTQPTLTPRLGNDGRPICRPVSKPEAR